MTTLRDLSYMIEANTDGLNKAFPVLEKMVNTLERLDTTVKALNQNYAQSMNAAGAASIKQAGQVSRSADQVKDALKRQEAALIAARARMLDLNNAVKAAGGNPRLLANNTRAYNVLERALKKTGTTAAQATLAKAKFNSALATSRRELQNFARAQQQAAAAQKAMDAALLRQQNLVERTRLRVQELTAALEMRGADPQRLKQLSADFEQFEQSLKGGVLSAQQLSDATNKMNASISEIKRDGGLSDMALSMSDLASSVQVALGPLSGVASRITAITSVANRNSIAIAAGVGAFIAFAAAMTKAITAGAQYEKQMYRIQSIIDVTNNRIGMSAQEIDGVVQSVAHATTATQTATRNAAATLMVIRGMSKDLLRDALLAAQGLAILTEGDIFSQSRRFARILEDPAGNIEALAESGVVFNAVEKDRIRLLQESGRIDEARAAVMERLQVVIAAATGETQGLAGAWHQLTETWETFWQNTATQGGMLQVLTSVLKDLDESFANVNKNTKLAVGFGVSFRIVAEGIKTIIEGMLSGLNQFAGLMYTISQIDVPDWMKWVAKHGKGMFDAWMKGPTVWEAAEIALRKLGLVGAEVEEGLDAAVTKMGELNKAVTASSIDTSDLEERWNQAFNRLNKKISEAGVLGIEPDVDFEVLNRALEQVNTGNLEAAVKTLEDYMGIAQRASTDAMRLSDRLEHAGNEWVRLRDQHLGFVNEQKKMEAQLHSLTTSYDDMIIVLERQGMTAEQAAAHLSRLRSEIILGNSSIESFLNQQRQSIEMQKREADISSALGAEKRRLRLEQQTLQQLWASGIITSSNYTEALIELRKMGFGHLADEIARTTAELEKYQLAAEVNEMRRGLMDNLAIMREEVALAGVSERERALGMDIVNQKIAMLKMGLTEANAEWGEMLQLTKLLSEMDFQKQHVEAVKSLKAEAAEQERVFRAIGYTQKARESMVALAQKEYDLLQRYGSLQDERAKKELELFKILQERDSMIKDWQDVAKVIDDAFSTLEDSIVEFVKTGEFNFGKLISSISEDIFRMTLRMTLLDPMQNWLAGALDKFKGSGIAGPGIMPDVKDLLGATPATPMFVSVVNGLGDLFNLPGTTGGMSPLSLPIEGGSLDTINTQVGEVLKKPLEDISTAAETAAKKVGRLGTAFDPNYIQSRIDSAFGDVDPGYIQSRIDGAFGTLNKAAQQTADNLTQTTNALTQLPKAMNNTDWLNQMYAKARASGLDDVQSRLFASQAALESGWGKSAPGNNFFGIKAGKSWQGEIQKLWTKEQMPDGSWVRIQDDFRKYATVEQAFQDRAAFMQSRFPQAANAQSWDQALMGLQKGKFGAYATDQGYLSKLTNINSKIDPSAYASYYQQPAAPLATAYQGTWAGGNMSPGMGMGMGGDPMASLTQSATQASTSLQQLGTQVPTITNTLTSSFDQATTQAQNLANNGINRATSGLQAMADQGLTSAMQASVTTATQTQQMGIQSTVTAAQVQQLGMAATQAAAQMAAGGAASGVASIFHGGGIVGSGGGARVTGMSGWGSAPRLHGGLHPGEFRAILKKGEGVFTPDQMQTLADMIGSGGNGDNGPMYRSGPGKVEVNLNGIQDFNSFRKSKTQVEAGMMSAMTQAMRRQG